MRILIILMFLFTVMFSGVSEAVPTKVIVRAKAKDAKFIGSKMGKVQVVIKDSLSGKLMSEGYIEGGTGNTKIIMRETLQRGAILSDASTAKFETTIDINEPRLITVEAEGPLGWKQTIEKVTTQLWLIPGKNFTGDGIVLEFYGFAVDVITPSGGEKISLKGKDNTVPILAKIVMI